MAALVGDGFVRFRYRNLWWWRRRDTAENWTEINPVLRLRELGIELHESEQANHKVKIGDGTTPWTEIPYATADEITDAIRDEWLFDRRISCLG